MSLERRTPLRARAPGKGGPATRRTELRAKRWGVRPAPKEENWRTDFLPDWMMAPDAPKRTPYEKALAAFVRRLPCCVCGRAPERERPNQASHVALSADQKGHGMKVPHVQVVSMCSKLGAGGCHEQWDQRRGFCGGWSRDRRYDEAEKWLKDLKFVITPDDRDHADELERAGLGKVIGDGTPTGWAWLPGHLVEVPPDVLERAVPA